MNRFKKTILYIVACIFLFILFLKISDFQLSPTSAYRVNEKRDHRSQADIVHIEKTPEGRRIYSSTEKEIFLTNIVKKGPFWQMKNWVSYEKDPNKALNFGIYLEEEEKIFIGSLYDMTISNVEIEYKDGEKVLGKIFDWGIFIIKSRADREEANLRGYNNRGQLLFQQNLGETSTIQ